MFGFLQRSRWKLLRLGRFHNIPVHGSSFVMSLKPNWCNWKYDAGKLWSKADSNQGQDLLNHQYLPWTLPYHTSLPKDFRCPWSPDWSAYLSQFNIFVLCQIEDDCCIKETRFFFDKSWIHFDILKLQIRDGPSADLLPG